MLIRGPPLRRDGRFSQSRRAQAEPPPSTSGRQNGIARTTDRDKIGAIRDRVDRAAHPQDARRSRATIIEDDADVVRTAPRRRRRRVECARGPAPMWQRSAPVQRLHRNGGRRRSRSEAQPHQPTEAKPSRNQARRGETTTIAPPTRSQDIRVRPLPCQRRHARRSWLGPEQQAAWRTRPAIDGVQARSRNRTRSRRFDLGRAAPLVDDPQFREISQTLPKLQADLQTLRERRNKIQPTAATP
jgi:hypothetical protein